MARIWDLLAHGYVRIRLRNLTRQLNNEGTRQTL